MNTLSHMVQINVKGFPIVVSNYACSAMLKNEVSYDDLAYHGPTIIVYSFIVCAISCMVNGSDGHVILMHE